MPAYVVMSACIGVLVWKTIEELYELVRSLHRFYQTKAISQILLIVDLALVIDLTYMVMIIGYNNFVSRLRAEKCKDRSEWLSSLDYAGLKIQVLGSVIAVSTINMLRIVVDVTDGSPVEQARLMWVAPLAVPAVGTFRRRQSLEEVVSLKSRTMRRRQAMAEVLRDGSVGPGSRHHWHSSAELPRYRFGCQCTFHHSH